MCYRCPVRKYDKTMLYNTLEMYCPYTNGKNRINPLTKKEYNLNDISKRYCIGRILTLNVLKYMSYQLMLECKADKINHSNEMFIDKLPLKSKLYDVFIPMSFMEQRISSNDTATIILIRPEAFRLLFYIFFIFLAGIAVGLTEMGHKLGWNNFDTQNNPILTRFGANNLCVFLDEPPFIYISASLWVLCLLSFLFFQICDFFRTKDRYNDGYLNYKYYVYYKISTIIEIIIFIFFTQSLAVRPKDSMIIHTMPYVLITYAFFLLCLKKYIYYYITGLTHGYGLVSRIIAYIYIILLFVSLIGKSFIIVPNLFGARMWEIEGLEWTGPFSAINGPLFEFLTLVCPLPIYWKIGAKLRTITITINMCVNLCVCVCFFIIFL